MRLIGFHKDICLQYGAAKYGSKFGKVIGGRNRWREVVYFYQKYERWGDYTKFDDVIKWYQDTVILPIYGNGFQKPREYGKWLKWFTAERQKMYARWLKAKPGDVGYPPPFPIRLLPEEIPPVKMYLRLMLGAPLAEDSDRIGYDVADDIKNGTAMFWAVNPGGGGALMLRMDGFGEIGQYYGFRTFTATYFNAINGVWNILKSMALVPHE